MFKKLWGFLCGYYVLSVPVGLRGMVYDLLFQMGLDFFGEKTDRSGRLILRLPVGVKEKLEAEAEPCLREALEFSDLRGFPVAVRFLRRRLGILLGALAFLIWSYLSGRMVWDIRIEGNTVTPDSEIIALLSDLGCGYGAWIPSIDYDDVQVKFLAASDSVAWMSVFMNGTVAEVQVRELHAPSRTEREEGTYANVVASEDGVIEIVRVFEGKAAVQAGDVVKAGDVVISGIIPKKDGVLPEGGIRAEYAAGEVIAKTVCRIDVQIAAEREEKTYTGAETRVKTVNIFGKDVNLFKNIQKLFQNTGIAYAKYDKIDKIKRVSLFGLCSLPIWIKEEVCREYVYERKEVPAEQMTKEAFEELRYRMDQALENGELLSKTVESSFEDGVYTVTCILYIRRDIAETVEFRGDFKE